MSGHSKRNLLLTVATAVGVALLTVLCWVNRCDADIYDLAILTAPEETKHTALEFDYNLGTPSPYTRLVGVDSFDPRTRLAGDAPAHVRIFSGGGRLYATLRLPPKSDFPVGTEVVGKVQQAELIYRRRPDGLRHPLRIILLTFEFYHTGNSKPIAVIFQQIELDTLSGTADYVPILSQKLPPPYEGEEFVDFDTEHRGELPGKINAPPVPAAILRMVYALAAVESQEQAEAAAVALREYAEQIIYYEAEPGAEWPDNWGDDAPYVRKAAQLLSPTLGYLKEHGYYNSRELERFIHSALFEMIFGI